MADAMKIAIMQPAFIPPASYFRLFAASDMFVFLDNVQFDRRWYTHRQKLKHRNGGKEWLTLPIKKTDRDTTMIDQLKWQDGLDLGEWYNKQAKNFKVLNRDDGIQDFIFESMNYDHPPANIVTTLLTLINLELCLRRCYYEFSSELSKDNNPLIGLSGQDRIIAICKMLGAAEYINSPGGRHLYDEDAFEKEGIKLTFLPEWEGSYDSILERLANEDPEDIRKEIYDQI